MANELKVNIEAVADQGRVLRRLLAPSALSLMMILMLEVETMPSKWSGLVNHLYVGISVWQKVQWEVNILLEDHTTLIKIICKELASLQHSFLTVQRGGQKGHGETQLLRMVEETLGSAGLSPWR